MALLAPFQDKRLGRVLLLRIFSPRVRKRDDAQEITRRRSRVMRKRVVRNYRRDERKMGDKDRFAVKHSGRRCDRRDTHMLRRAEIRVNASVRRGGALRFGSRRRR